MVTYDITATVSPELAQAYEEYMTDRHIPDLLETGHFAGAVFSKQADSRYRVQYHSPDQGSLDAYFTYDAERLRADVAEHFPVGLDLSREVWSVLRSWAMNDPFGQRG